MPAFSGHLAVSAQRIDSGVTTLARQSFQAPFHLGKPYWDGHALIVQVVNPTAGILEGDRLASEVDVRAGASLLMTTPSATRVFTMRSGSAESIQRFEVGDGGWLEYWPEPLVPHKHSSFRQETHLTLERGAGVLFADFLLPGRIARGESWAWSRLVLEFELKVGGVQILRERLDQSGAELRGLAELSGMGEGAAFGNLIAVSDALRDESRWKDRIAGLHGAGCWVGVSALRGDAAAYSIKLIAQTADVLRRRHRELRAILSSCLPGLHADPRKL